MKLLTIVSFAKMVTRGIVLSVIFIVYCFIVECLDIPRFLPPQSVALHTVILLSCCPEVVSSIVTTCKLRMTETYLLLLQKLCTIIGLTVIVLTLGDGYTTIRHQLGIVAMLDVCHWYTLLDGIQSRGKVNDTQT